MQIMKLIILFIMLTTSCTGCNTLNDVKMARGKGRSQIYDATLKNVWKVTIDSINTSELTVMSEDKTEGRILAQRGLSINSYGEVVAIFITSLSENKTRVEIVSKKALVTNFLAPDWTKQLFESIGNRLKMN